MAISWLKIRPGSNIHPPGPALNRLELQKRTRQFIGGESFCVLQTCIVKTKCPSARATDNTPAKQHADGTPHRYRSRRTYKTVHIRDGVELVPISGRQQQGRFWVGSVLRLIFFGGLTFEIFFQTCVKILEIKTEDQWTTRLGRGMAPSV
jgi:hypothetical protein